MTLPDKLYSIDAETLPIGESATHPKPVVWSICATHSRFADGARPYLVHAQLEDARTVLRDILREAAAGEAWILGQNIAFDMVVAGTHHGLMPEVYAAYAAGNVRDLALRAKLFGVQTHGGIEFRKLPDGSARQLGYSLAALVDTWLGEDISETKTAGSWRTRYSELLDTPVSDWDQAAIDYALDDTAYPIRVWDAIEKASASNLWDDCRDAEVAANKAALACARAQQNGFIIDPHRAQSLFQKVRNDLHDITPLVDAGIITPALPARPYTNGAKSHVEGCTGKVRVPDGTYKNGNPKFRNVPCDCPVKMSAATPQKTNDSVKREWFRDFLTAANPELSVPLTDGGIEDYEAAYGERKTKLPISHEWFRKNPRHLKLEKETLEEHQADGTEEEREVVSSYLKFQRTSKLWSSFLPGMLWSDTYQTPAKNVWKDPGDIRWAVRVHPGYDVLKRTGRMSSYAGSLTPSMNVQQQDPEVRPCFIADPNTFLVSTDYRALELFSAASTWKRLFGRSVLHDILLKDYDPHGFLGAQLAAAMASPCRFEQGTLESNYQAFQALKKGDDEDRAFYKYWRKFAKPVGLGFPGGLGVRTMRSMAWAQYGLQISEDQALAARELWMNTFPEARVYLKDFLRTQQDSITDDFGQPLYYYRTPMGMVRRGCNYTAAANGGALQSPAAEGLRNVAFELARGFDVKASETAPIYGCKLKALIHDEVIFQVPIYDDWDRSVAAIDMVEKIMVREMSAALDIPCDVESAAMFRWQKFLPNEPWAEEYDDFDTRIPLDPRPAYPAGY